MTIESLQPYYCSCLEEYVLNRGNIFKESNDICYHDGWDVDGKNTRNIKRQHRWISWYLDGNRFHDRDVSDDGVGNFTTESESKKSLISQIEIHKYKLLGINFYRSL